MNINMDEIDRLLREETELQEAIELAIRPAPIIQLAPPRIMPTMIESK